MANIDRRTVIYGSDLTMDQYLDLMDRPIQTGDLLLERKHIRNESWANYEDRWLPGTCPQENHVVHLTSLVTTHQLPEFAYERIRALIEDGAELKHLDLYSQEQGKHFSKTRSYDGGPAQGGIHAL